jgi:hypothetical protein
MKKLSLLMCVKSDDEKLRLLNTTAYSPIGGPLYVSYANGTLGVSSYR